MRWGQLIALAFTGAFLAACGMSSAGAPETVTPPSSNPPSVISETQAVAPDEEVSVQVPPQSPCQKTRTQGPGASVRRIHKLATGDREYLLYRPSSLASDVAAPLVFNFHGRGSDAATQERYSGLLPVAERAGFVLVTPEGTGSPRAWSAGATAPGGIDDIGFVADLLTSLQSEFCIDPGRVYATGFSNGAFMASRVACLLGDRISAFAAVAGVEHSGERCAAPVAALAIHGTKDGLVPFDKGMVRATFPYGGARSETKSWAAENGCGSAPAVERVSASVTRETYAGGKAVAVLYVVQGGGHTWPGAPDIPALGTTTHEVNAAELIWAFFASHARVKA